MNSELENIFDNTPNNIQFFNEGVDMSIQKEYMSFDISDEIIDETQINELQNKLSKEATTLIDKKTALIVLAHIGSVEAFRIIEKYLAQDNIELKGWATLALQECRMFLENELTDNDISFISTGLGGTQNKMRCYCLVLSHDGNEFSNTQKQVIKNEYELVAKELNCDIELIEEHETSIAITVLIPMNVAIATFLEQGISQCNELGETLFPHYYVTNVSKLKNIEEINEIITIIKNEK